MPINAHPGKSVPFLLTAAGIFMAGIFLLDLATPLGKVVWALYTIPLLLSSQALSWQFPVLLATVATILILLGVLFSPPGAPAEVVFFNRSMGLGMIWMTALLIVWHQRAEKGIRENQQRLQMIMDHANDAIFHLDLRGVIQWASQQATVLTGRPLDHLVNHSFVSLLTPASATVAEARLASIRRGEPVPSLVEFEFLHPYGATLWVEANIKSVRADGTLAGRLLVAREITERKRMEADLQFFKHLLDHTHDPVYWLSPAEGFRFVYVNEAACKHYGYPAEELLRMSVPDWDPNYPIEECERFWQELKIKKSRIFETLHRRRTGEVVPVEVTANYVAFGGKEYVAGTFHDITERKRAEEARRAGEERYRTLVEHAPVCIHEIDLNGRLISMNQAGLRMMGVQHETQIRGLSYLDVVAPEDRERIGALLARAYAGEGSKFEFSVITNEGTRHFTSSFVPISGADGSLLKLMGITQDVTERQRAEQEKAKLEEQLRQAQKMEAVGRLAGGIAHDFNNMLTVITGYSDLLLQKLPPNSPDRKFSQQINDAGKRAATLTGQLLAFSRSQILQPKVLDLNQSVAGMASMLRRLIGEQIVLTTDLEPVLGRVKADSGQVEQVIMNLTVNARDAMPLGGRLTIQTANAELDQPFAAQHVGMVPGSYVLLAVSDTGSGMDADTQARIFEPFFTTKAVGRGTGLGLATVYGIVKQSGGSIWVYSEVGLGATFKIYLPRVMEEVAAPVVAAKPAARSRETETILVAEDQEAVRAFAREVLEQYGYTVLEARDAREALQVSHAHPGPIDLLVTDVVMPEGSGRDVVTHLATSRPRMKALFMSGYMDNEIISRGGLTPSQAFLQKPFSADALARKVREALDTPSEPAS